MLLESDPDSWKDQDGRKCSAATKAFCSYHGDSRHQFPGSGFLSAQDQFLPRHFILPEFPLITAFIFINMTTAFIYSQFCNLLQRNTDILLLQQQIKLSEQYYEDLSLSQQRLKGIRHDMKNHLQSLSWIAARITPASRETEELQEYLGQLTQDIGEASQILSTGNMGMDAILSLKIGQAKEQKINVHSKISVPKEMDLATEDSIIIFGNLLDNAIKACRENPEEKDGSAWISITFPVLILYG